MITLLFALTLFIQSQTNAFYRSTHKQYTLSLDRITATINIRLFPHQHFKNQSVETDAIQIKSPSFKIINITAIELFAQNNEYYVVVPLETTKASKLAILNLSSSAITPKYIDLNDCHQPHYVTATDQGQIIIGCSNGQIMTINGNTSVGKWTVKKAKIQRFQPFNNEYTKKKTSHYLVSSYNMDSIVWQIRMSHYNASHMVIDREYKLSSWHHTSNNTLNSKHLLVTQSENVNVYDITHMVNTEATLTQQATNHFMQCSSTKTYVQFIKKSNRNDIIVKCYGKSILNLSIVDRSWQISMVNTTEYNKYGPLISNVTAFSIGSRINENGIKQLYLFLLHGQTLTIYTQNNHNIQLIHNEKVQKDIEQIQFISINSQHTLLMAKSTNEIRVLPIQSHVNVNYQYKTRQLLQISPNVNPCADQICTTNDECEIIDTLSGDTITGICEPADIAYDQNQCNICTYATPNANPCDGCEIDSDCTYVNLTSATCDTDPESEYGCNKCYYESVNSYTVNEVVFYKISTPQSWYDARAECRANGDDLASIHSQIEQDAARAVCGANTDCWIGISINTDSSALSWTDGSDFDYGITEHQLPWASIQPTRGGCPCCAAMVSGYGWADTIFCTGAPLLNPTICRTTVTTPVSAHPSADPTKHPSADPTKHPSADPTMSPTKCYNEISDWKVDQIGRSAQFQFYDFCDNHQFIKVKMDSLIEHDGDSKATQNRINSFAGQDFGFATDDTLYETFPAIRNTFDSTLSVGQGKDKTDVKFTLETIVFYNPSDDNANTLKWSVYIEDWPFDGEDHTLQLCVNIMTNGGDLNIADFVFSAPEDATYDGNLMTESVDIYEDVQKGNENHRYFCYTFNWFAETLVYDPFIQYIGGVNESKASFISIATAGVMFGFIIVIIVN